MFSLIPSESQPLHETTGFFNSLLKVMNELRNRGVEDILIAVVDGLKGFPEAITTVFPLASVQTYIVHLSRYCLSFCGWKESGSIPSRLVRSRCYTFFSIRDLRKQNTITFFHWS